MLNKGDWLMIRAQLESGVYLKDVAAKMEIHPRTVRRALDRGGPPSVKRRREKFIKLKPDSSNPLKLAFNRWKA